MIETLFIIGNGFDCYCHKMKTKYSDFREHVLQLYPESKEYTGVPEMTLTLDHHDYAYDDAYVESERSLDEISDLIRNADEWI